MFCRKGKSLTGTARYASINQHKGFEPSRRDDMESIGYLLMYFLRGSLPWQGVHAVTNAQKYEKISEIKMKTSDEELCLGFPPEFLMYFKKVKAMEFEEEPDYAFFKDLFRKLHRSLRFSYEIDFDWTKLKREMALTGTDCTSTKEPSTILPD